MNRWFVLFCVCCGLSDTVKGVSIEELNQKADEAARSAYVRINQNWKYPENNTTPVSSTSSWEVINITISTGSTSMVHWNSAKQPHLLDALEEIFDTKNLIMDCSNAARLVRLYMICQMLGKDKTLSLTSRMRNQYADSSFNFMNALSWSFLEKVESVEEQGIYCFPFINIEKYPKFKPDGMAGNHNVVRLLDKTYFGFEPSFFDSPKSHEEVEKLLYDCFIKPEDVALTKKEEHQTYSAILQKNPQIFAKMRKTYQERLGFYKFNMEKVEAFLKTE